MLSLSVLAVVAGAATLVLAVTIGEDGHYDTRYNHLDIERILNNKRLVTYYAMCLTGDGPCTPQGTEFKRILPEALRTTCARCTEKQKITAYLAIRRLKKEYPKIWQQLQVKWDPTGELVSTFFKTVETSTQTQPVQPQPVPIPNSTPLPESVPEPVPEAVPVPEAIQVNSRFGGDSATDNEIAKEAPSGATSSTPMIPLAKGIPSSSTIRSIITTTTTSSTTSMKPILTAATESSARPPVQISTETNYRTSFRPTRLNILLPRPHDFGTFTVNVFGSIGDLGSKVIRTGARIADMVLSGVQEGVRATIQRTRPQN